MGMGRYLSDALLQFAARLLPPHLPNRMTTFRDRFEHHLLLRMDGDGVEEVRKYLEASMPSATGDFFECDQAEGEAAFRHRYAVGGASVRYRALHRDTVENIVALDLAMPRNTLDWRETLPDGIENDIVLRIPCGHFFCNVFHYDYAVRKGADWLAIEHRIIAHLAGRGIEFPAEHNVGHLYEAKPILRDFFRTLDPTNSMNPGIGGTPRGQGWS
jgi:D-lactate dehydrogenase